MTTPAPRRAQPKVARGHLTVADVCEELGITRSTFYDWRAKRKAPPCLKLPNGDIRIRRAAFENWLNKLEEEAA
ncbi:helix-turn-helix domain-containing protein [Dactylosporangium roseum]|uniref:Helix-turn-helix domain-containing protein n=1 Tax=Dactylosporangium roseum TaxID=47989 RepID=A0ABY5ZCE2_9ACTN|nr:helix-turn-helix domain-containing protein [Dactylosporangium roseum]UWZ38009.1 helix-turn-helix domain-containing protein [Dactylosporangium roseum]